MGETIFRAMLNAIFGGLTVWWLVGAPTSRRIPDRPAGHFRSLGTAFLHQRHDRPLRICSGGCFCFHWIYQKLAFIFGGMLIPLDFYPNWLQSLAKFLPFSSAIYGPARLFVSPTYTFFISVMSMQLIWVLGL